MDKDTYVLCRVFHKNNIGPPSGNRYAPFIEEEWDDGKVTFPGEDAGDDLIAGDDVYVERNGVETMNNEKVCFSNFLSVLKFLFYKAILINISGL